MQDKLIVALDDATLDQAKTLMKQLEGVVTYYKIGFEFFTAYGWEAVNQVRKSGAKIFLDLKLHDIPTTVAKTAAVICDHEIEMFNVHALGGLEMMKEVRKTVDEKTTGRKKPAVIAVTVLTSHTEETLSAQLGVSRNVKDQVLHLAGLACEAGLDGVVSSPKEIEVLRKKFPKDFLIVTPGIRPAGSDPGDQKRIFGPREAVDAGSSHIVVGRPITASPDPREAALQILKSICIS